MKHFEILNKLINVEESYSDLDKLLKFDYEFEEIPLITRLGREHKFIEYWGDKEINTYFLNVAIFLINSIKFYSNHKEYKNHNFMITYPDLEDGFKTFGCHIPNICIVKNEYLINFYKKKKLSYEQASWLFDSLQELGFKDSYDLYVHESLDFGEMSTRIYLIPKSNIT